MLYFAIGGHWNQTFPAWILYRERSLKSRSCKVQDLALNQVRHYKMFSEHTCTGQLYWLYWYSNSSVMKSYLNDFLIFSILAAKRKLCIVQMWQSASKTPPSTDTLSRSLNISHKANMGGRGCHGTTSSSSASSSWWASSTDAATPLATLEFSVKLFSNISSMSSSTRAVQSFTSASRITRYKT